MSKTDKPEPVPDAHKCFLVHVPLEVLPLAQSLAGDMTRIGVYLAKLMVDEAQRRGLEAQPYREWIDARWRVVNPRPGISMGGMSAAARTRRGKATAPKEDVEDGAVDEMAPTGTTRRERLTDVPASKKPVKREVLPAPTKPPRIKRETL